MPWIAFIAGGGGLGIAIWLARRRRRFRPWDRKAAIDRWYAQIPSGEEPTIAPLRLPKIRSLKAERSSARLWARMRRVK